MMAQGTPRSPGARGLEAWAWILFAAALFRTYVYICETLALPNQPLWFFFSSDTVQTGLIYKDLFEDGFHFAGWNISHAPEYLQMVVALLLRGLAGSLTGGHVLEAMAQPLLLALALRRTLARLDLSGSVMAPLIAAAVLYLVATNRGLDYIAFIWSNRHGYTAILAVLGLGLCVEQLRGQTRLGALLAVAAAGVASDMLFLVWFVGPAMVAAVFAGRSAGADARRLLLALVVGSACGFLLFWTLTPVATVGSKVEVQPDLIWGGLHRIADMSFKTSGERTFSSLLIIAGLVVSAVAGLRAAEVGLRAAGAWGASLVALTLFAVAATGAPFREEGYTRYLLAPQLFGLVVTALGLRRLFGSRGSLVMNLALSAAILPGLRPLPLSIPHATGFYPPLVQCLDQAARTHRLEYGVADYWLAKYVTALSRSGLRVVPVTPRLDPFANFTNIEWFLGGVGARRHDAPRYTFAILGAGRPQDPGVSPIALGALGATQPQESCGGYEVRLLPQGADERIREQFRANPRIQDYYKGRGLPLP